MSFKEEIQQNSKIVKYIAGYLENKNPPRNDGWTPLHSAAENGHFEIVKYIAGHLENKNPARNNGTTPLLIAAQEGHFEIVKYISILFVSNVK